MAAGLRFAQPLVLKDGHGQDAGNRDVIRGYGILYVPGEKMDNRAEASVP